MRNLKKSARADHLAATAADRTIDGARSLLRAAAVAFVAGVELSNFDFLFRAESRFFERDLHVVTQIGAALSIFALSGHAAEECFENTSADSSAAATEDFAENIERIVEPAAESAALFERRVTEPVVGGAFVSVHQHVVGFAKLLEFLFGVWVVRIFVGMKFDRELAIGALDLIARRRPCDFKDFVVIALGLRHLKKC